MSAVARFFGQLHWLDWTVLALYFALSLAIGLYFVRRASASTGEFFVSGRNLPWWLAGTSMVATSFSVDTPLVVTGWVRTQGIQRNWIWWCLAIGGMLSAFVFARLWRRSEVMTDVELTELRYSGRPATWLRGFRAVYMTLYANCLTMAWVTLAMVKVFGTVFDVGPLTATLVAAGLTLVYAMLAGLWGVVVTDLIQFALATLGAVVLAVFVVDAVGGLGPMVDQLRAADHGAALSFLPALESDGVWSGPLGWSGTALATFLVLITIQWWANKNADGGAVVIQRMAASKDEREAVLATLWFQVANYALRPWPWIIVALASLLLYPDIADPEMAYPRAMIDFLPVGLLGLMLASLVAAFMSTLTSYINLSAAYLVNDLYRPFIARGRSEQHYVSVGRVASALALAIGVTISFFATSISQLFLLLLTLGAGIGLVYIARWFWWRVNAWSEIAAMIASAGIGFALGTSPQWGGPTFPFAAQVTLNLVGSTVVWVAATLATPPVAMDRLIEFYRRVRPPGWWGPVRAAAGITGGAERSGLVRGAKLWALSVVFVYAALFGSGKLLLLEWVWGTVFTGVALITGWALLRRTRGLAVILLLVAASAPAPLAAQSEAPRRVLFVGNSLTAGNDVPRLFAAVAAAGGDAVVVDAVTFPNFSLEDHLRLGRAIDEIEDRAWDVVVLQQGPSSLPESRRDLILWTRRFAERIRAAGAEPALYMVWPPRDRPDRHAAVRASYTRAAEAVGAILLPVGDAWEIVRGEGIGGLYGPDGFHPTTAGSLLAAMTIYGRLYGVAVTPLDVADVAGERVDAEMRAALARAADAANGRTE